MRTGVRVLALLVLGLVVMELALRWALFRGPRYFAPLRRAELYADSLRGDLYFRLAHAWREMSPRTPDRVHPELGWSQGAPHPQNPLGLRHEPLLQAARKGPKFVVFGSSVIDGRPYDLRDTLPNQLARSLGKTVVDVSVGGFSPEQVLMMMKRYRDQFPQHPDDHWLIGLASVDLDRSGTAVYSSLKPYFRLNQGELCLTGVPVPEDQLQQLRRPSGLPSSFLLTAYRRRWQSGLDLPDSGEVELNRALIKAMIDYLQEEQIKATFLLYCTRTEMLRPGWREPLIGDTLQQRGYSPIRIRSALQAAPGAMDEYYHDEGHFNGLGNLVASRYVVQKLGLSPVAELTDLERLRLKPLPNAAAQGIWREVVGAWEQGWLMKSPGSTWRICRRQPGPGWEQPAFDDSLWTWASDVGRPEGTPWPSGEIWLRSRISLKKLAPAVRLRVLHPGPIEVYLDGRPLVQAYSPRDENWRLLRWPHPLVKGEHLLAVHCRRQVPGGLDLLLTGARR